MSRLLTRRGAALFAGLFVAVAAAPRPVAAAPRLVAAAGPAAFSAVRSLTPLFDTQTRFKKNQTVKLRFRLKGRPQATLDALSFSLRHGMEATTVPLRVREVRSGVFEVPFTPPAPGQYWILADLRGAKASRILPVRLGVIGVADGMIEVPPQGDIDVMRSTKTSSKSR
jgi:hypothetical protein